MTSERKMEIITRINCNRNKGPLCVLITLLKSINVMWVLLSLFMWLNCCALLTQHFICMFFCFLLKVLSLFLLFYIVVVFTKWLMSLIRFYEFITFSTSNNATCLLLFHFFLFFFFYNVWELNPLIQ